MEVFSHTTVPCEDDPPQPLPKGRGFDFHYMVAGAGWRPMTRLPGGGEEMCGGTKPAVLPGRSRASPMAIPNPLACDSRGRARGCADAESGSWRAGLSNRGEERESGCCVPAQECENEGIMWGR